MTTSQLIDQYLAQRDLMATTLHIYKYVLRWWFRYLVNNGIKPAEVKKADIIGYKRHLFSRGLRSATVDLYINGIKGFYRWMAETDEQYRNITTGIRNEKRIRQFRRDPLTIDQVRQLIGSIPTEGLINIRDRAIVCLLYFNALRVVEAIRLDIGDIDLANMRIAILGKGRKEKQWVQINDITANAIEDYIQAKHNAGEEWDDNDPLFIAYWNRNRNEVRRLRRQSVSMIMSERLRVTGIKTDRISAHSLRHSAAVHMIESGKDLYAVTLFLRHTNANTSRLYTHFTEEKKLIDSGPTRLLQDKFRQPLTTAAPD
jgi:site-specific recombinase XerD